MPVNERRSTQMVELSHSQTATFADKLDELLPTHRNKKSLAKFLGVDNTPVYGIMRRGAATRLSWNALEKLATKLEIDITKWDVSTSDGV